jgi:hypothetical protein
MMAISNNDRRIEDSNPDNPDARFGSQGFLSSREFEGIQHDMREAAHARLSAEVMNRVPFNMHDLWSILRERPLVRADLEERNEVVNITQDEFDDLLDQLDDFGVHEFKFIDQLGRLIRIFRGTEFGDGRLIISHEDLGQVANPE